MGLITTAAVANYAYHTMLHFTYTGAFLPSCAPSEEKVFEWEYIRFICKRTSVCSLKTEPGKFSSIEEITGRSQDCIPCLSFTLCTVHFPINICGILLPQWFLLLLGLCWHSFSFFFSSSSSSFFLFNNQF